MVLRWQRWTLSVEDDSLLRPPRHGYRTYRNSVVVTCAVFDGILCLTHPMVVAVWIGEPIIVDAIPWVIFVVTGCCYGADGYGCH